MPKKGKEENKAWVGFATIAITVNCLAWATGPGALVLSVGAVAVGLTGIGAFCWNKAMEYKMQKRQSSGYLRHFVVTSGIVIFLLIFFYCFTSFLTDDKNGVMSNYRN